ncbi:hypothetical protein BGZ46_005918 [Entomortierella lignicola]|nr:hypothetical protein BGZ46_005918 [Entomortierella lignicola]
MTRNTHKSHWLARTLVPVALLAAGAQSTCISLATSKACSGAYGAYSVDTTAANIITNTYNAGVNISTFNTVDEFDQAIFAAGGFLSSPSTCTGYNPSTDILRYQTTLLCTLAVQTGASIACSKNETDAPNLCASSCTLYANSLSALIAKDCPTDNTSKDNLATLVDNCDGKSTDWPGIQDTSTTCANAVLNEASTCGFGSTTGMCSYCATNATDTCCSSPAATSCLTTTSAVTSATAISTTTAPASPTATNNGSSKGLSTAALGGIIGGGVVLLLLLFSCIICCIRRNKSPAKDDRSRNLSRHISNSSTSKYNISAPKIQEEGFAASIGSAAPIPMTTLPHIAASEKTLSIGAATLAAGGINADRMSKGSSLGVGGKPTYCQALYPYHSSMADELDLTPGDIVNVHKVFDDGWAVGVNMNTSNEGAFPVVCVMFVDEASLEDDFEDVNMHSMTPMGNREDDLKGSQRSSLPSRTSSPVNLPRRHSSMLRDSAIIPGVNAPMASSPLAGGNNNQRLQAPVRDTMMSDASSINRWWEGEGSTK